ncbi:MAG: glutamate racemase [Proteobacteria bacterium]|nr:glutamate racemase [Pseudomonadota bacterium]
MSDKSHNELPIGVFDSGVGGLTVLKAIRETLPNENLVYLGDTARLPYGTKSPASIERYATQAAERLQQEGIKLLVVACNTASAVALGALRAALDPLPVVGVVEPGATAAVEARPGGRHLVLATEATVGLHAYRDAIAGRDAGAEVREKACEMLVALAEEGWSDGEIARAIVRRYLCEAGGARTDTIILGCTHFPLLIDTIRAVAAADAVLIDSASTTAGFVAAALETDGARRSGRSPGTLRLLATDGVTRFARVGGRFLGHGMSDRDVELIDL